MITSFTLENLTTQETVLFSMDVESDYVYKPGGVDWGNVPATHNTYNYPKQVGVSISSTKINERDIAIEAYAYYVMSAKEMQSVPREDWKVYGYQRIKEKKNVLNGLINPDDYIKLTVGNYYIEGKPASTPYYSADYDENNEYFCKFLITLYCANPMFKKKTETRTAISGDTSAFHFPLIIPDYGTVFGTRVNYLMLAVENEGNVPIGGLITFKAKGEVKNPAIENVMTGEKIKINKTLQNGEVVKVNTVDGQQRGIEGYYQGVTRDYLQYWDYTNTWFKFLKGTTLVGYSTENASETSLDVTIEINPQKYGLEEM